jgi:alanine racemase
MQLADKIHLWPVLSWHALISEIKTFRKGDYIGYDLTEKMTRAGRLAIVPIGYWHGLPRAASSVGEFLIKKKRARILGRVSMDLTAIDVTGIDCRIGDKVEIPFMSITEKVDASHYEIITRINPLIQKIII